MRLCGISSRFQLLSPGIRQVTHALLTRPPLSINKNRPKSLQRLYSVRLACVKHAASVHPEPGSNSHVKRFEPRQNFFWLPKLYCFFKVCSFSEISMPVSSSGLNRNFQGCISIELSRNFLVSDRSLKRQLI